MLWLKDWRSAPFLVAWAGLADATPTLAHFELVRQDGIVQIGWEVHEPGEVREYRLEAQLGNDVRPIKYRQSASGEYFARDLLPTLAQGELEYRLLAADRSGNWTLLGARTVELAPPAALVQLRGATPNPFNPRTTIRLRLWRADTVSLAIYDARGRELRRLLEPTRLAAGEHGIAFDGRDGQGRELASGTYYCRVVSAQGRSSQRLTLLK